MATRRVRRDSETSTDSWSLVEEDRLDDDFSLNSTEAEEEEEYEDNEHAEPIVEEPLSSDEDTASEHSDCDSDSDSDSDDSDLSENSEIEEDNSEIEEGEEEVQEEIEEESENSESEQSEESEEELEMSEEEKEAARMVKEDEEWMDEEVEEDENRYTGISLRIFLFGSLFLMLFPIAEICTSWVLTYHSHRNLPKGMTLNFNGYSQQRYNFEYNGRYVKGVRQPSSKKFKATSRIFNPLAEHLLRPTSRFPFFNCTSPFPYLHPAGSIQYKKEYPRNKTIVLPEWAQPAPRAETCPKFDKFLAPIPPAPFSPRKQYRSWTSLPRYQPCLVHVNESKWTCQKSSTTSLTVMPRKFGVSKRKIYQKKDLDGSIKKEICGKKASQSMRVSKPKDQCDSPRHLSKKYTPKRHLNFHRIEYKAPLPCQAPTYRPTPPKPSRKPSKSADDWFSRRSHVRAQLRSRA